MNTWTDSNVEELHRSLEKAMSPDAMDSDRFGMGSPDSGIHVNSFELGFNEALLGLDDPIFSDISNIPALGSSVEPIHVSQSEIISDFSATVSEIQSQIEVFKEEIEDFEEMEEEEEEDEEDLDNVSNYSDEENEEKSKSNIPKDHPVEIHSYSAIKIKKEQNFKAKAKRPSAPPSNTAPVRKQTSAGRKYKVSISQKKRKLYEMEPLVDPVAEKNRLNALNAKKNRDRKKQQLAEAESEISRLREENEELRTEADEARDALVAARRELAQLKAQLKAQTGVRQSFLGKARAPISSA